MVMWFWAKSNILVFTRWRCNTAGIFNLLPSPEGSSTCCGAGNHGGWAAVMLCAWFHLAHGMLVWLYWVPQATAWWQSRQLGSDMHWTIETPYGGEGKPLVGEMLVSEHWETRTASLCTRARTHTLNTCIPYISWSYYMTAHPLYMSASDVHWPWAESPLEMERVRKEDAIEQQRQTADLSTAPLCGMNQAVQQHSCTYTIM